MSSPKIIQRFLACHHLKKWSIFRHQRFHAFFCPSLHDEVFATVLESYPAVFHCILVPFDGGNSAYPFFKISFEMSWLASFDWPQPDFRQFFKFSQIFLTQFCSPAFSSHFLYWQTSFVSWNDRINYLLRILFVLEMLDRVRLLHSSKKVIYMLLKNDHFLQTYCHFYKIQ